MEETTGSAQNWAKQTLQAVSDEKETLSNHDASEFVDASFREFSNLTILPYSRSKTVLAVTLTTQMPITANLSIPG